MGTLLVQEHSSNRYSPRTWVNASDGDVTCAFAVDFSTAGEKLTHKAAGPKYIGIELNRASVTRDGALASARLLYRFVAAKGCRVINVAGNGIYTLSKHGWSQEAVNLFVASVMAKVHEHHPFQKVISGGQTGVDLAGAIAGGVLGVDEMRVLLPKGLLQRHADGADHCHTEADIRRQIDEGVRAVRKAGLLC